MGKVEGTRRSPLSFMSFSSPSVSLTFVLEGRGEKGHGMGRSKREENEEGKRQEEESGRERGGETERTIR